MASSASSAPLVWFVCSLAVGYLSMLLHELGHAAVALQQTSGPVVVQIGSSQGARRMSFGRLGVSVSLRGCGGVCLARQDRPLSRASNLKRVLAGPAVNLVLALLFGALALRTHGLARIAFASGAVTNALSLVANLVPRHLQSGINRGRANDGLKAWCLLRGKPVPAPPAPRTRAGKASTPVSGPRRMTGGTIGMTLAIVVIGGMVSAGRLPADQAMAALLTVAIFAWFAHAGVRRGQRGQATAEVTPISPGPTLKRCPSCGAEVHSRARLCYCDHEFD